MMFKFDFLKPCFSCEIFGGIGNLEKRKGENEQDKQMIENGELCVQMYLFNVQENTYQQS